jgi:hypothetical protein
VTQILATPGRLYAQCHDRVYYIVVVLLQSLDGLFARDTGLSHDQLDILVLKTLGVNLFSVIFIIILLGITLIDGFALSVIVAGVVVARVVVASMVVSLCELLSCICLGLGVEVLNLGLSEDTVYKLV